MDKKSLLQRSNDLLNRIIFFFVGVMVNVVILLACMKLLQVNGLILSLIAIFIINMVLYKKFKQHPYIRTLNLGILVSNILFTIVLILGLTLFNTLNSVIK